MALVKMREKAWRELYRIILLFSKRENPQYLKINAELLFLSIFLELRDAQLDAAIENFIIFFQENDLQNGEANIPTLLLIDLYLQKRKHKRLFPGFTYSISGLENCNFTQKEIDCYLAILSGKAVNKVNAFFNATKVASLKNEIHDVNALYYFTHDIFYLSYLAAHKEYFATLPATTKTLITEFIYVNCVYCMTIENIDLLTELLICHLLFEGKVEEDNVIIAKGLWFIEQYLNKVAELDWQDMDTFLALYHTLLLICMLTKLN